MHEGLSGLIIRVLGDGTTSQGKMTGPHSASRRAQPPDGAAAQCDVTDHHSTYGRKPNGQCSKCKKTYPNTSERHQPNRESAPAYATHGNSAGRKYDAVSPVADCNPAFSGKGFTAFYTIETDMNQW